ncbi:32647_t:CDS:1, partial [Racocetra persica]
LCGSKRIFRESKLRIFRGSKLRRIFREIGLRSKKYWMQKNNSRI